MIALKDFKHFAKTLNYFVLYGSIDVYYYSSGEIMNLMQLYNELLNNESNSYYAQLAEKEILLIPILIEVVSDSKYSERMKAKSILEIISQNSPEKLVCYFDYLVSALSRYDDLACWCLWKIVVNLIEYNPSLWEKASDKFVDCLGTSDLGKFCIVCDCCSKIAASCPQAKDVLTDALKAVPNRQFFVGKEQSQTTTEIAIEKANATILSF